MGVSLVAFAKVGKEGKGQLVDSFTYGFNILLL